MRSTKLRSVRRVSLPTYLPLCSPPHPLPPPPIHAHRRARRATPSSLLPFPSAVPCRCFLLSFYCPSPPPNVCLLSCVCALLFSSHTPLPRLFSFKRTRTHNTRVSERERAAAQTRFALWRSLPPSLSRFSLLPLLFSLASLSSVVAFFSAEPSAPGVGTGISARLSAPPDCALCALSLYCYVVVC